MSYSFINESTGKCQGCKLAVQKDELLQCETCNYSYHPFCSASTSQEKLCTKTLLAQFNAKSTSKPNFSWKCNVCVITQDTAKKTDLAQVVHGLVLKVDALTTALNNFKQETKQNNTTLANTLDSLGQDIKQDITSIQPLVPQSSTQRNPWANTGAIQKLRSSFLVEPSRAGNADIARINEIASEKKIQVDKIGVSQKGNTFIHCPTEEASLNLRSHIEEELGLDVYPLQDPLPSISITGITAIQWDVTQHETPEHFTNFTQKLRDQNPYLDSLITDGETFKIIFMKPPNVDYDNFQIVARVSPKIRDAISTHWNKLYIGAASVRVYDRFYVKRCNKCNNFGHYKDNCTQTSSCGICGVEGHESAICNHNADTSRFSCINCKRLNLTHTGHTATSRKCPAYLIAQKKVKGNIPYYQGINNTSRPPRR